MSIHYKFRSAREYDTITVDGGFISLFDLKKAIIEAKKLGKSMDLDLEVVNAQTNEAYTDESTLIPKNTSVIVRRVPTTKMASLVQPASAPTHVAVMQEKPAEAPPPQQQYQQYQPPQQQYQPPPQQAPVQPQVAPLVVPTESGTPTVGGEEDRIMALINQADDWHATGTTKDTGMTPGGHRGPGKFTRQYEQKVPPPNYICHRCNQPGHFINQCPTNGDPSFDIPKVKKPTGIPRMYLKPVAGGDSRPSLILPGGQFAVMAANEEVLQREVAKTKQVDTSIPDSLRCPLCGGLLNDAVLIPCCGYSFCEECIRPQYPNDVINCPMCHKTSSASRLVPNLTLRTAVEQFKKNREEMKVNRVIPQRPPEVPRTMPTGPAMPLRSIPTVVSDTPTAVVPAYPAVTLPVKTEMVQPLPSAVTEPTTVTPATSEPPVEEVQLEGNDSPPYSPSKGLGDDASDDKSTRAKSPGSTKDEKEDNKENKDKDGKDNKDDKDKGADDKQYYQNQGQYGYYGGQYPKGTRYCFVCGSPGHQARECPNRQAIEAAYSAYGYPPYYMDPAAAAYYGGAYPGYGYDPRMQGYQDDWRRRRRSRSRGRSRSPRGRSRSPRGRSPRRSPRRSRSRGRSGDRRRRSPSRDRGSKRKRSTSREDKRDDKSKRARTDDKDRKDDKSPRDDKVKKDDRKDDKAKDDKERASSRDKDKKTEAKQSATEEVTKMDVDEPKEQEKEATSSAKSKPKEDDRRSRDDKDRKDSKRDESRKEDKKDDRRDRDDKDKDRRASDKRDDKDRKDDKDRRDTKKDEKKEEKKDDKRSERKDEKPKGDKQDDKKDSKSDRRDERKDDKPRAEKKEDKRDDRKEESRKEEKDKREDKKDDRRSSDKRDDKRDQKKDDKRDDKKDDRHKRDERKEDKKDERRDDKRESKKDEKKDDRKEESRRDDKRTDVKKDERKDERRVGEKKEEKAAEPKKDEPSRKRKLDESSGSTGSVAKKPRLESAVRVVQLSSDREEEPRVKIIPPDHTLKERENKEKRKSIIHEILTGRRDKEDKEKLRKSGEKKDDKKEREVFIEGKKMAVTISPKSERKDAKRSEERRDRRR